MAELRLGLDVAQHQLQWQELLDRVRFAEASGFEGAWVFDHFAPLYADPNGPCLEGWTLLAGLAAATSRIRLGVLVSGVTYRHPSVLATEAVTIDHISNGRLDIGMGAAWQEAEHEALGIPFPPIRERAEQLEEAIQVMRALMTKDRATFSGKHYRLADASYRPRPVQRPHPPIWIGASGEQLMLPIVARQSDAWHANGPAGSVARKSRLLDDLITRAGRDPRAVLRSASLSISEPWDDIRRRADALRQAGFEYLVLSWPSEGRKKVEDTAARLRSEMG